MNKKRIITAIVTLTSIGSLAVVGVANAQTTTQGSNNIVDQLSTKFGLKKADVQQVFDQDRANHLAQMQTKQKAKLDQAVKDGKLTQSQEDYIIQAQKDIQALLGTNKSVKPDQASRDAIKVKIDALHTWAVNNKVDLQYIGHPFGHGHHAAPEAPDVTKDSSSTAPESNVNL